MLPPPSQIIKAFVRIVRTVLWLDDVKQLFRDMRRVSLSRDFRGTRWGFKQPPSILYSAIAPLMNLCGAPPPLRWCRCRSSCWGSAGWEILRHSVRGISCRCRCHPLRGRQVAPAYELGSPQSGCASNAAFDRGHFSPGSTVYRVGDTHRRRHRFRCRGRMAGAYAGVAFRIFSHNKVSARTK